MKNKFEIGSTVFCLGGSFEAFEFTVEKVVHDRQHGVPIYTGHNKNGLGVVESENRLYATKREALAKSLKMFNAMEKITIRELKKIRDNIEKVESELKKEDKVK